MSVVTSGDVRSNNHENINISAKLWHRRRSHLSDAAVEYMIRRRNYGMRVENEVNNRACEMYVLTKQSRAPSNRSLVKNTRDVTAHFDICGPILVQTYGGKSYFLTTTARL